MIPIQQIHRLPAQMAGTYNHSPVWIKTDDYELRWLYTLMTVSLALPTIIVLQYRLNGHWNFHYPEDGILPKAFTKVVANPQLVENNLHHHNKLYAHNMHKW